MIVASARSFLGFTYLLASSPGPSSLHRLSPSSAITASLSSAGGGGGRRAATTKQNRDGVGRSRYGRSGGGGGGGRPGGNRGGVVGRRGRKRGPPSRNSSGSRGEQRGGGRKGRGDSEIAAAARKFVPAPPPPLTEPGGPRPSYYTCRHTYEGTLMREIERAAAAARRDSADVDVDVDDGGIGVRCSSPYPGLVRVEAADAGGGAEASSRLPLSERYDPAYALQAMPDAVVVRSESIKGLARGALDALLGSPDGDGFEDDGGAAAAAAATAVDRRASSARRDLRSAPRGSLAIHALVPGMLKGQPDPAMRRRADRVAEEAAAALGGGFAASRAARKAEDGDGEGGGGEDAERWALQILLLSPEVAAASLTRCDPPWGAGAPMRWPNWDLPAGLANVDIEEVMPSSAYRKLLEAFRCLRRRPPALPSSVSPPSPADASSWVVDLGACPGGWTAALRMMGCAVVAVDRSALDPSLMEDAMVRFVRGDAFSYEPPWAATQGGVAKDDEEEEGGAPRDSWMVSDVIAYPERVAELLERWCGGRWVENLVITVKFQGSEPAWDDLDAALAVAEQCGYDCRAKHFFNNKNEVTLMASERGRLSGPQWVDGEDETGSNGGCKVDDGAFLGRAMFPVTLPRR